MTRKILVIRRGPRQRIAPVNKICKFFHVGFVKSDAKAANTDTITPVNIVTPYILYKKSIG
jgi:hypothetical protein